MTDHRAEDSVEAAQAKSIARMIVDAPALAKGGVPPSRIEGLARAYLALLSRVEKGWQPIETAPKQLVILLWALTDTGTGNWKMATGHWSPGYRDEPGEWTWGGRRLKPYDIQPTHWRSLPSPPSLAPREQAPEQSKP